MNHGAAYTDLSRAVISFMGNNIHLDDAVRFFKADGALHMTAALWAPEENVRKRIRSV